MPDLRPLLLALALASPSTTLAQDAGEADGGPDAGDLPDASVGAGGADRTGQEFEDTTGRVPQTCHSSSDCERGFTCDPQGRCAYQGVRETRGCGGGTGGALAALFAWAVGTLALGGRARSGR